MTRHSDPICRQLYKHPRDVLESANRYSMPHYELFLISPCRTGRRRSRTQMKTRISSSTCYDEETNDQAQTFQMSKSKPCGKTGIIDASIPSLSAGGVAPGIVTISGLLSLRVQTKPYRSVSSSIPFPVYTLCFVLAASSVQSLPRSSSSLILTSSPTPSHHQLYLTAVSVPDCCSCKSR